MKPAPDLSDAAGGPFHPIPRSCVINENQPSPAPQPEQGRGPDKVDGRPSRPRQDVWVTDISRRPNRCGLCATRRRLSDRAGVRQPDDRHFERRCPPFEPQRRAQALGQGQDANRPAEPPPSGKRIRSIQNALPGSGTAVRTSAEHGFLRPASPLPAPLPVAFNACPRRPSPAFYSAGRTAGLLTRRSAWRVRNRPDMRCSRSVWRQ